MHAFFQKYGGKHKDPYEAIELIFHKLHQIKEKVAKADPSHIKDLSGVSDMIDDYVNSIKEEDLKPIQINQPYQDYPRNENRRGMENYANRDNQPLYGYEHQPYEHGRNPNKGYNEISFDGPYRESYPNPRR